MSPRGSISTVITTVLGVTLGGLLIWRVYRRQRKRLPCSHKAVDSPVVEAAPPPLSVESPATPVSSSSSPPPTPPPPTPALPSPEQLLRVAPVVVGSEDEWERAWPALQKDLAVFPVLGLDCEWVKKRGVSVKGRTSMVSLLQMASYSGRCVLVRMLSLRGGGARSIPLSLMEVLRDPHVLKVGVGCYEDAKRLIRDHGLAVGCTVDLRYLVLRRKVLLNNGMSLKSLASDLLGVSLDKSLALRCSDWEAKKLTADQVRYAAGDAQVSVALFFHLLGLGGDSSPSPCSSISPSPSSPAYLSTGTAPYARLAAQCQGLVDVPFREGRGSGRGAAEGDENTPFRGGGDGGGDRRPRRLAFEGPEAGDQQVPDPRRNQKRKPLGVGYFARKSPLYDNCFLYAPDGEPLCTCDKKKAKWYLDKGLGVLESQDPFVVRLLFEPAGRPESKQDYYLTAKENLCVVCGKEDSYIRKNIVPHEYRRHFPAELKDHNSHDILLLCTACHAASNVHDGSLKQLLAEEHGAPQGCEEGVRVLEDSDRRRVRSAARALLTAGDALPQRRRSELQGLIQDFLEPDGRTDGGELTSEDLQYAAELETRIFNASYVPHGLKVVRAQAGGGGGGLRGLMELERRWRQHFLSSMRPRHLPPLWAVDHNHRKLRHKYGEDLPVLPL
ncbi:exonuclease 3'-5' domain-containing protein 2 isoform X1 [Gadus morhua]|uniref:exonuclease 3'-5' domain-containing protein 2 isoform X1 n=1 Tax=Gadus morhua TaxID=8049 RepID=UPI0011B79A54|nr:exonuclease 3'-5' domain-containing protein 2 isoform X1 [Gadus morhua]